VSISIPDYPLHPRFDNLSWKMTCALMDLAQKGEIKPGLDAHHNTVRALGRRNLIESCSDGWVQLTDEAIVAIGTDSPQAPQSVRNAWIMDGNRSTFKAALARHNVRKEATRA
jgi:hypothetical protein